MAFDLVYPGHFDRRLKSVRVTIPCVTGPFVNVGATLTLLDSAVRQTPSVGQLTRVPPTRTIAVATSTAQNDAGVFELSFRDEKYMPFEGAGAVSEWRLQMPTAFRPFDYRTINDVILSLSYTASHDGAWRQIVDDADTAVAGSLGAGLAAVPLRRLFSLRNDFGTVFHRLLQSPLGTQVAVHLDDRYFPALLRGRNVRVDVARAVLQVAAGASTAGFELDVDGAPVIDFAVDAALADRPSQDLPAAFFASLRSAHSITVTAAGDLASAPGGTAAVDTTRLEDILLFVEYRVV